MNIKSIFAAIIMFIANILSSVKDLYNSIFNGKVDISNSTIQIFQLQIKQFLTAQMY